MKITCGTDALVQHVAAVERAVANSETQPILNGIYLEARGESVILRATDREIAIETVMPGEVEAEGACVIDGRTLSAMVRKLPGERTSLQVEPNGQAVVRSGAARFAVPTRRAEEFPELPAAEGAEHCRILQTEMRRMIRQTTFAVSHEESRPYLTGVLLEVEGAKIRMVATDASRLALRHGSLSRPSGKDVKVIVPAKSLAELSRLLVGGPEDELAMAFAENQVIFTLPGLTFVSRLIEGNFPDYRRVFPASYHTKITVERRAFLDAVERALLVARKGTPSVRLSVHENKLALSATEQEVGDLYEEIPVTQEGGNLEMWYQSRFLSDVLRVIEEPNVVVEMGAGLLPAVVYGEGDEAYRYVVMPVRVG